ncbi:hypothetical protein FDP41_000202 [Naegleria fowleri]|uniref:Ribosomal protein L30 ferredoxin-like fold domain-containing protein n=1 Tax=Naegleria fowleri TaxID=5763 RepID=A0A6A5C427_NAEFO|nr:uncharacterized protein FDP41_000202 [Naegleria fowleri]KAF0985163.1 hypothetical protein FDP41_000202 [Naegleria fowleri]CAG4710407.1 unnamed protein product [Naegleria fowleri]
MVVSIENVRTSKPAPETVLKRRKRLQAHTEERSKLAFERKKKLLALRKKALKRAEKFAKEYKQKEANIKAAHDQAAKIGSLYVEPQAKLAFVIRIRGIKSVAPKVKKALQLLRLRQINNGVFVRLNKATLNLLKLVEPFVAWGYPSLSTVKQLIYKRGCLNINGDRKPITSNVQIEEKLGSKDIVCVEDLIHEIYTVGPNFKAASNFLWPFKLQHPKGGYETIKKHFILGGSFGNREEYINQLVKKML